MQIEGVNALVAGGASGLGAATARALNAAGANVTIADIDSERGSALAEELGADFITTDVTQEVDVEAAVRHAAGEEGLRVSVSCAGIGPAEKTAGRKGPHSLALFERVIAINLIGSFNVLRLAAAKMLDNAPDDEGQRGVHINTASIAAFDGQIGQVAYSASKGGIVAMTLPIARDLMNEGIRINTILPGIFNTPLMKSAPDNVLHALAAAIPFPKRLGDPAEYAQLALSMIENSYFNGEDVRLDGAFRMGPR